MTTLKAHAKVGIAFSGQNLGTVGTIDGRYYSPSRLLLLKFILVAEEP